MTSNNYDRIDALLIKLTLFLLKSILNRKMANLTKRWDLSIKHWLRLILSDRFRRRRNYNDAIVFTSRDKNKCLEEWTFDMRLPTVRLIYFRDRKRRFLNNLDQFASITFMLNCAHLNSSDRNDITSTFWLRICSTYSPAACILPLNFVFRDLIDRSRRTMRNTSFRRFRNPRAAGRIQSSSSTGALNTSWRPSWTVVPEYPANHRFWSRGCWRKWKKFPNAVYQPGIPMLKIYSDGRALLIFRLPFALDVLADAFYAFLLRPLSLSLCDKKCGYM